MNTNDDKETLLFELERINELIDTYKLVQSYHGCDSWKDVFSREFNRLNDLKTAVEVALKNLENGIW
jgi:hypothetical protein